MGAVTRDTFTVVNDPLIRLDKKLGPTGFSRQGEKFLIIGLPWVHLLLLNGNISQGYV